MENLLSDDRLFQDIKDAFQREGRPPSKSDNADHQASQPIEPIDGYEIIAELHRGGQGIVYNAVQKATKRNVALKVLLHGELSSLRQRQRFEREIDLVASLRHRNIVTIYDSGVSKGRPYYAMEHIDGQALGLCQRARDRSVAETLMLFQSIATAVGYAHQHGVIHRDLKPGNILVDALGEPHVLDFGLAKLTQADGDPLTSTGEFLGTLAYASPEQTRGDPQLIDVRTDVYSLGIILFEMLTGAFPYPVTGSLSEVLRIINETPPSRPSLLCRQIDNEVETIVLKALAKEPERRYQSAERLARDVEDYLNGRPIDAKRDSTWYVLKKTLRRHRGLVSTAAALLLTVAVALVVSLAFWQRAVVDRDRAQQAEIDAHAARQLEEEQRRQAESHAYAANVAAASAALENLDVADARQRLERAPLRLRDWEWRHLNTQLDFSRRTLAAHTSYVYAIAYSPDGKWLLTGSWDRHAILWSVKTGAHVAMREFPAPVRAVAFSPDGRCVAVGTNDQCVRLWDPKSDRILATFTGPTQNVLDLRFSPDGARLAVAYGVYPDPTSLNRTLVWDVATAKVVLALPERAMVQAVSYSPDGARIATAAERDITIWDAVAGSRLRSLTGHTAAVSALAFSQGILASSGADKTIRLWDSAEGTMVRSMTGHTAAVQGLAFSPDGSQIVSGSRDKTVRVWDVKTGEVRAILRGHTWNVTAVAFSPDGREIASASWDHRIKLWRGDARNPDLLQGHTARTHMVAFHPDGKRLASASWDRTVRLWDLASGKILDTFEGHDEPVMFVAFSPNGAWLASSSWDQTIRLWNIAKGGSIVLRGHTDRVHGMVFTGDGKRLVSGSRDNTIRIWNIANGECLQVVHGHTDHIHCVAFSPDERWLASSGHQTLKLWDTSTWSEVASFPRTIVQDDFSLAFHPDGRRIAAGTDFKTLAIWDLERREIVANLDGHTDEVRSVVFSPDGKRLISSSLDGSVKVWDVESATEIVALHGYAGNVFGLALSPDGATLAAGLESGGIKLWRTK